MPFINIKTSAQLRPESVEAVKAALGDAVRLIGKSEGWLMVNAEHTDNLFFKGEKTDDAAFVSVNLYGSADSEAFNRLTGRICGILQEHLGISPARTYVMYYATPDWGFNGSNF